MEPTTNRLAAALAIAALLPLAGCATPYGGSRGAWAYYDKNYGYGQEGYDRPIAYSGTTYGEATQDRPPANSGQAYYYAQPLPNYAGEATRYARQNKRCNCARPQRTSHDDAAEKAAHDPSWTSTYYAIGP